MPSCISDFVVVALVFGPRVLSWLLREVTRTGSRELFTLSVRAVLLPLTTAGSRCSADATSIGSCGATPQALCLEDWLMTTFLELCSDLPEQTFASGDTLFTEGERSGRLYILAAGEVEVRKGNV
jgi:hypothetical protein